MNKDTVTSKLKNKAKELDLSFNRALSQFFFDEFLRQVSLSKHKDKFILKGGILLAYWFGLKNRSTHDIDFLIKKSRLSPSVTKNLLEDITRPHKNIEVWFEVIGEGKNIRAEDRYGGLRFHIVGHLSNIRVPFAIDIATGDPVYPVVKAKKYMTILGDSIDLNTYSLESVLAEKLHTILTRAENNSRSKDFYDMYAIIENKEKQISIASLRIAIVHTFNYRDTHITKEQAKFILHNIANNQAIYQRWIRYQKKNPYAQGVDFTSVLASIGNIIEAVL